MGPRMSMPNGAGFSGSGLTRWGFRDSQGQAGARSDKQQDRASRTDGGHALKHVRGRDGLEEGRPEVFHHEGPAIDQGRKKRPTPIRAMPTKPKGTDGREERPSKAYGWSRGLFSTVYPQKFLGQRRP